MYFKLGVVPKHKTCRHVCPACLLTVKQEPRIRLKSEVNLTSKYKATTNKSKGFKRLYGPFQTSNFACTECNSNNA